MNSKTTATLILGLALAGLGCQTSNVDENWGDSYRALMARQTAEPEAAAINADEPTPQGLDGMTTDAVVGKYIKKQESTTESKPGSLTQILGVGDN